MMFSPLTPPPKPWQDYLHCRTCKHAIIEAIGLSLLQSASSWMKDGQRLVIAGCLSDENADCAWVITSSLTPYPTTQYKSTAEEADIRIWRHAMQCTANQVLIYSPDTDIYNIGLGCLEATTKIFIVQVNVLHSTTKKFLHLNNLKDALMKDPDTACLAKDKITYILQALFACSGCDYVSYFKNMGKATFFNHFFKHTSFICGRDMPGSLHQVGPNENTTGFLSFIRLIGSMYFNKHISSFATLYNHTNPHHSFNAIDPSLRLEERHKQWIQHVASVVAERITTEEQRVPSVTSLWRHWKRSCWTLQLWLNSPRSDPYMYTPPPEESGWIALPDGTFGIDWEDSHVQSVIEQNINFLLKGCSCKKGCTTTRCGCKKKSNHCGPGCECQGCNNLPTNMSTSETIFEEECSSEDETDESGESEIELETEIITEDAEYIDDLYLY